MNLFKLVASVGLDTSDYKKGVKETTDSGKSLVSRIGSTIGTVAKATAAGVTAAASGISAIVGMAVKNYAEYEQLVGGVETLFKDSADTVQEYAAEAYKTAGLSANDYMEQATSMSAALLKSLGGDTEAAAEYADRAIVDMSDNANKMGTDIQMIQNAYSGFTRGNFTMLDNLKLGFAGSKEGMQELLDTAKEITGYDYDITQYGDIVDAIHVVQEEMGITGTTAAEASETISGSVSAMKSAWSNLVTGIADDNANMDLLMSNFVESVAVAGQNILPRVEVALNGASMLIQKLFPVIMEQFPTIIHNTLPRLLEAGVSIIKSLIKGVSDSKPLVVSTVFDVIKILIGAAVDLFPDIIHLGADLIVAFLDGMAEDPESVIMAGLDIVTTIVEAIFTALPKVVKSAADLIKKFLRAIYDKREEIWQKGVDIVERILTGIGHSLTHIITAGSDIVNSLIDGIKQKWDDLTSWFNGLWDDLFGGRDVDVNVNGTTSGGLDGSHAGGLYRVPFDGYVAQLHAGERVLTAQEAKQLDRRTSGVTVIQNIYSEAKTAADLMQEALYEQRKAVLLGV